MARLAGKIAVVTGAAKGIGAGIAAAFLAEGAVVYITDIDDETGTALAKSLGQAAHYLHLDVANEDKWHNAMATVLAAQGRLDILVNNAGITGFEDSAGPHDPEHCSLAEWHRVHAVNLDGTFLGCKQAISAMRPNRTGSIINMSSRSGLVGIPGAAAYASSKAAIRNHTKTVALYCAQEKMAIRCNSIHPAAILTPMWDAMLGTGPERALNMEQAVAGTPLQRFGSVEEVAAIAVLLASDEATYITGSEFNIDGGLLAGSAVSPKAQ
jgi:3(or 17)beta-hydroxysteroid dehydrogenase